MKTCICLAMLLLSVSGADEESELYERVFESVSIDEIIDNDRILYSYLRCFYNEAPCSPLAEEMKSKIPEVLSTVCGKCTERQKEIFKHELNVFIPKKPDEWKKVMSIYDPDNIYWPKIKEFMES